MRLALVAILGLALGGCVSAGNAPEWFAARSAEADAGYPSLRSVPTGTSANTDAAHWAAIEADLLAARTALRNSPRSQPASATESPAEFLDQAREDLEETRQSHDPN
ncbi:MAG: hypothetical protein KJZ75_03550 [Hyphomonadaceae bacterium]|nr:hypothetical protein [Hyphomonadaceae bacterium]GIK47826.1 MAG: hypothetical protein BroJett013_05230 [Alphaproteobacteria bacterium]